YSTRNPDRETTRSTNASYNPRLRVPNDRSGVSSCASMYGTSAPADACDAPRPGDRMSRTVTDAPRTASSSATAAPTTPAPITTTRIHEQYRVVRRALQLQSPIVITTLPFLCPCSTYR